VHSCCEMESETVVGVTCGGLLVTSIAGTLKEMFFSFRRYVK